MALKQQNEIFVTVRYNKLYAQACTIISSNRLI